MHGVPICVGVYCCWRQNKNDSENLASCACRFPWHRATDVSQHAVSVHFMYVQKLYLHNKGLQSENFYFCLIRQNLCVQAFLRFSSIRSVAAAVRNQTCDLLRKVKWIGMTCHCWPVLVCCHVHLPALPPQAAITCPAMTVSCISCSK